MISSSSPSKAKEQQHSIVNGKTEQTVLDE